MQVGTRVAGAMGQRMLCPRRTEGGEEGGKAAWAPSVQRTQPETRSSENQDMFPALADGFFTTSTIWEAQVMPLRSSKKGLITYLFELGVQPG